LQNKRPTPREVTISASAGAVVGFIGTYIGNVILNALENRQNIFENRTIISEDIAGILVGTFGGAFTNRLSTLQLVVLSVSIFYVVSDSIDKYLGLENLSNIEFLEEYLIDVPLVYIITKLQILYVTVFFELFSKDNDNEKEDKPVTFESKLRSGLLFGFIITIYFAIREYNRNLEENQNNINNENKDKEKDKNLNKGQNKTKKEIIVYESTKKLYN